MLNLELHRIIQCQCKLIILKKSPLPSHSSHLLLQVLTINQKLLCFDYYRNEVIQYQIITASLESKHKLGRSATFDQ